MGAFGASPNAEIRGKLAAAHRGAGIKAQDDQAEVGRLKALREEVKKEGTT
jgi:hypothetical protein